MPRTRITGCSSGFGQGIAEPFHDQGWQVITTMPRPAAAGRPASDRLQSLPRDVTNPGSVATA
ncbi:hypothetical protein [Phaeovulum sp. W22_SRMD_FR3]|uniref:hypothetical protein n=1 Tax=Phaeovulum sp. W22_SRMD_FR3 TaxID=3240274 RepID=UPI003F963111